MDTTKSSIPVAAAHGVLKRSLAGLFVILAFSASAGAQQWRMGFRGSAAQDPLSTSDWAALTHVIQVGVWPQADGSLLSGDLNFDANTKSLISAAHANHVKVLVNVWSAPGSDFKNAIGYNLTAFVNNLMNLVDGHGYDGIDVDWEAGFDPVSMGWLLSALRSRLGTRILTADAGVGDQGYWPSLYWYVDRVNIMTYDMGGFWDPYSWYNSALYGPATNAVWSVQLAVTRFLNAGIPAAKLNIGIPFYGYIYQGGGVTGPDLAYGTPLPSRSQIRYGDIATTYDVSRATFDSTAQVPWLAISNGWITFDNATSVTQKVKYATNAGLGGFIIWTISSDWTTKAHPLLTAVGQTLTVPRNKK